MEASERTHAIVGRSVERLTAYIGHERVERTHEALVSLAQALDGRRIVNVTGDDRSKGGVFEILRTTLPYLRGADIDVTWIDLRTEATVRPTLEYFHVLGHGTPPFRGWREQLPIHEQRLRAFGAASTVDVAAALLPSDVVVLHDTQSALIAGRLEAWAPTLVWRAHIGTVAGTAPVREYWRVLTGSLRRARACVFYLPEYAPRELRGSGVAMLPSIDPSSPKNAPLQSTEARLSLPDIAASPLVSRLAGDPQTLGPRSLLAVQVARWDPLKAMDQALAACARRAARDGRLHGLVIGPEARSDSERTVLERCLALHTKLPPAIGRRMHVWSLSGSGSSDHDEIVRRVQCAADIVLQTSIREGFGLTVAEAMLRGKPVIATGVGGMRAQIEHAHNGWLLDRPEGVDDALERLSDPRLRERLGRRARADALANSMVDRHLRDISHHLRALLATA